MHSLLVEIKEQGLISFSSALGSVLGGRQLDVVWELDSKFLEGRDFGSFMCPRA